MSNETPARDQERPADHPATGPAADVGGVGGGPRGFWATVRLPVLRVIAVLGALVFLTALFTAFAAVYTSRPAFCRSCHNMEPYYQSWAHSSHNHVSCVKCHFPPGVGEKVRGKMAGLVQLTKYVTAHTGPRPVAEVSDASCLRSGCHETRLLAGKVEFHGIHFDHKPHLLQMRRGKKLRCTSCHSQIVQGKHMTVTTSTCFLCHFKEGHFNQGLGACTRCHQIPERMFDLGGGVTFHHDLAYEKGVDCANCHGDLIRGNGDVPADRCRGCHNREDDFARIDDHLFLHQKHVTEHKVDCLECHLRIHHSPDPHHIQDAAANCASCHPNHHAEQVDMLEGVGAETVPKQGSSMIAARIACPSCHRIKEVSSTGTVLWKASIQMCTQCHDDSASERLWAYHKTMRASLADIGAGISRVRAALDTAELAAERVAAIRTHLQKIEDDLNFLRVGNGVHNIHYASTVTRALVDQLTALSKELKIDPPTVTLPGKIKITN